MKRNFCLSLFLVLLFGALNLSSLSAQEDLSLPLQSSGTLPHVFATSSTEKYEIQVRESAGVSNGSRRTEDDFFLETNFGLDQLFRSGMVNFGDPLSQYLTDIGQVLLRDEPSLQDEISFFIVYSPFPNAFATTRGNIFVNIGLIARLETEAQLAFVLAHEIAHYQEKHSLQRYVEYKEELWEDRSYRRATNQDRLTVRNNYSRRQEIEADSLGLLLYKNSPFGEDGIDGVFDILKAADKPAGYSVFQPEWLESSAITASQIDSLIQMKTESTASWTKLSDSRSGSDYAGEDEEGEKGTHPSPELRQSLLEEWQENLSFAGEELFMQAPSTFTTLRRTARLETCMAFLHQGDYLDALQMANWIHMQGEEDPFLLRVKLQALYGISMKLMQNSSISMVQRIEDEDKVFLSWLSIFVGNAKSNSSLLALSNMIETYEGDTVRNAWLKPYLINLLEITLQKSSQDSRVADMAALIQTTYSESIAYQSVRSIAQHRVQRSSDFDEFLDTEEGLDRVNEWREKGEKYGYSLGIDSILVFSPEFYRLKIRRKKRSLQWVESEKRQEAFSNSIPDIAEEAGIYTSVLDPRSFTTSSPVSEYNDAVQIQRWMDEIIEADDLHLVPSNHPEVLEILGRRGIDFIATTGVYAINQRNLRGVGYILYTGFVMLAPSLWPYLAYQTFKREENGYVYLLIFDVEDPSIYFKFLESPEFRTNQLTASHYLEFFFFQISQTR